MGVTAMTKTNIVGTISITKLRTSLGQSLLSFSFDIGGLLTGALLLLYFDVLSINEAPWAIFLFPGILSIRGAVGGLFSGHLGTGLHLGTIIPSFTKNTKDFQVLLRVIITLALISGVSVGTGTWIFGMFLWNATIIDFFQLLTVITATMALSVVFVSPLTIAFSVISFKRGLDPDIIVYPITSTMSDIISTMCYVFSFSLFFMFGFLGRSLVWILDFIFIAFAVYILVRNLNEKKFAETIREFLLTLAFVTVIANVTGSFLARINGKIIGVYPSIITTVGGVGSIIGSTVTTKLALGVTKPSLSSIKKHTSEIGGAWLASIVMFVLYVILSTFGGGVKTIGNTIKFTLQLLTTNFLAISVMVFIAYAVAILTFRRGWNPDNFVIPIESSLADTVTTVAALTALAIIT
jgi:mgtE-like transporter